MEAGERWKRVQRESQCLQNFIIQHSTVGLLVERERRWGGGGGGISWREVIPVEDQFAHRE